MKFVSPYLHFNYFCGWDLRFSGMLHVVNCQLDTDVSVQIMALVFNGLAIQVVL